MWLVILRVQFLFPGDLSARRTSSPGALPCNMKAVFPDVCKFTMMKDKREAAVMAFQIYKTLSSYYAGIRFGIQNITLYSKLTFLLSHK